MLPVACGVIALLVVLGVLAYRKLYPVRYWTCRAYSMYADAYSEFFVEPARHSPADHDLLGNSVLVWSVHQDSVNATKACGILNRSVDVVRHQTVQNAPS